MVESICSLIGIFRIGVLSSVIFKVLIKHQGESPTLKLLI